MNDDKLHPDNLGKITIKGTEHIGETLVDVTGGRLLLRGFKFRMNGAELQDAILNLKLPHDTFAFSYTGKIAIIGIDRQGETYYVERRNLPDYLLEGTVITDGRWIHTKVLDKKGRALHFTFLNVLCDASFSMEMAIEIGIRERELEIYRNEILTETGEYKH